MYIFRNCNRLPFSLFFFFQLTWATAHTARAVSISNIPILSVNRFQRIGSFFQYPSFLVCGISQHLRSTAVYIGLTQGHSGEESACSAEDPGLIPGLGRSPGKRNGNLLQLQVLFHQSMDMHKVFFCFFFLTLLFLKNNNKILQEQGC